MVWGFIRIFEDWVNVYPLHCRALEEIVGRILGEFQSSADFDSALDGSLNC